MAPRRTTNRRLKFAAAALVLVLAFVLSGGQAQAHKYYAAMTRISWNAETGAIEVVHRFFAHDLERALTRRAGRAVSLSDLETAEPIAAAEIADSFTLTADGAPLALTFIGIEVDGDYAWAYYEAKATTAPARLAVTNRLLTTQFPEQINTVTADFADTVRSANFSRGENEAVLEFGGLE